MNNNNLTESIRKFLYYLFVLYIIYATDSLFFSTNYNQSVVKASQYFIILLTAVFTIKYLMLKHKKSDFLLLLTICFFLFFSMFVTGDYTGGYFLKIALFAFSYFFFEICDADRFINTFLKIMKVIAVVSLIGFLFSAFISEISFLPILKNTLQREYISLIFANIPVRLDLQNRNYGPFWEPGVYQAYLIVALFFSLFYKKENNKFNIVLFTITMITTFSTTGIIALFFLFAGYVLHSSKKDMNDTKLKWLVALLLFAGGLYLLLDQNIWELVFRKLALGTESASFSSRWNAIGANIYIILQYPFFGCGPNGASVLLYLYLNNIQQTGTFFNVNTILAHFSIYGLLVGIYFMWNIGRFINGFIEKNILTKGLILLTIICILSGENFMYSLFFNMIFFINGSHLEREETAEEDTVSQSIYIKNDGFQDLKFISNRGKRRNGNFAG